MEARALHPTPRWSDVLREQFRAVGIALRPELLLLGALLAGLSALVMVIHLRNPQVTFDFVPGIAVPVMLLAILAPIGIWKGDEPGRRSYLWSMPVDRTRHTLAKLLGGWAWLMPLVAVYLLWGLGMTLATGGDVAVEGIRMATRELPPGVVATDADLYVLWWDIPAWQWVTPFTGVTITYLLGSAVVIWSDHPWRWFAGFAFVVFVLVLLAEEGGLPGLEQALFALTEGGRFGIESALLGTRNVEETIVTPGGRSVDVVRSLAFLRDWAIAMPLWLGLGAVAAGLAAYRHQER